MPCTVIAGLVLLLSATPVIGSGGATADDGGPIECVSQQELAAVKAQMERRVDQLHSQLYHWQNVTVNILKDHYSSLNSDPTSECSVEAVAAVLESTAVNFTQSNGEIRAYLEEMNENITERLDSLENSIAKQNSTGQRSNDTAGSSLNPAHNCSHILHYHPGSTSGHYWLQSSPGYAVKVFCDMERVCGCDAGRGEGGGWMRVADINMNRPNETCPTEFTKVITPEKTICEGQGSTCNSTSFSSHGFQYSRVCGKIVGYGFSTPDAFAAYIMQRGDIDTAFVDGIVLTHGYPKRNHIWTFAASGSQYQTSRYGCPCNGASYAGPVPPYVGNDYFCDSGHRRNTGPPATYLTDNPLWDGAGCVRGSCCTFNSPPWFCKTLPHPTTDDIELRLCLDQEIADENVAFEIVELYVQ